MKRVIPVLLVAVVIFVSGCTQTPAKDYSEFTQCVADSGIQEYGAYWCPNCARVKLTLGDAWHNLNYVECDPKCKPGADGNLPAFCNGFESRSDECLQLGVQKYPTWMKGNNILYVGTDVSKLAEVSGCQLPE